MKEQDRNLTFPLDHTSELFEMCDKLIDALERLSKQFDPHRQHEIINEMKLVDEAKILCSEIRKIG